MTDAFRLMDSPVLNIPEILHLCPDYIVIDKPYDTPINSDDPDRVSVETLLSKYYPHLRDPTLKHGFRFLHFPSLRKLISLD